MTENLKPPSSPIKKPSSPRPSLEEVETHPRKHFHRSSHSSSISRSIASSNRSGSQHIRLFLEALDMLDSLYICPITLLLPPEIREQVGNSVQRYEIKDYHGVTRFYAAEITTKSLHCLSSESRPFVIHMYDLTGCLLFECYRSCTGALCFCGVDCCSGGVTTKANFGTRSSYIGSVVTRSSCRSPSFKVRDDLTEDTFIVRGPNCGKLLPCRLCGIHTFSIYLPNTNASLGKIIFGYDGLTEELVPNPKTVGVIYPPRCTSEMKACLLAAGFMLEITYFNQRGLTWHRIVRHSIRVAILLGIFFVILWFTFLENVVKNEINILPG
ncbi:Phospholipid scramblase 2, partial [Orchesella cincta]